MSRGEAKPKPTSQKLIRPEVPLGRPGTWDLPEPVDPDLSNYIGMDPEKIEQLDLVLRGGLKASAFRRVMHDELNVGFPELVYRACSADVFGGEKLKPEVPKIELAKHDLAVRALFYTANGLPDLDASSFLGVRVSEYRNLLDAAIALLSQEDRKILRAIRVACENGSIPLIGHVPNISAEPRTS